MTSLYEPSNKLEVVYSTVSPSGEVLVTLPILFSESVPNAEQAQFLLDFVQAFEAKIAEKAETAAEGSVYFSGNKLDSSYTVKSAEGVVLLSSNPEFSATVSNVEQAEITALLAAFAVGQVTKTEV